MRLRSAREYWFRLHQLGANAVMWAFSGSRRSGEFHFLERYREILSVLLPPIEAPALRDLAEQIVAHEFPIFCTVIGTGAAIDWRRDYLSGKSSGLEYFRFVPYLDAASVGDHKVIWELNRHQHLVVLARAFADSKDPRYLAEIRAELHSWWEQNPFLKGINWASTLEVAFRSLSWLAVLALVGDELSAQERAELWARLHQHGRYIENNLSVYFAPNTHLLGEALALAALGRVLGIAKWQMRGDELMAVQRTAQTLADGGYFEQSTYYHVYALDMFVMHLLLRGEEQPDGCVLDMAHWLACILGPDRRLVCLGDDDGGNLFWPYGDRAEFGSAALSRAERACARAFPCLPSTLFASTGLATFSDADVFLLVDCGPFGAGGAGHSHSDTLSLVVRRGPEEILIDPGTYTYTSDLWARDEFRGSASHNTIRIDSANQAEAVHPFRWINKPDVRIVEWRVNELLIAECRNNGFTHRREFHFDGDLRVVDTVEGTAGEHEIEQFWHSALKPEVQTDGSFTIGSAALNADPSAKAEVLAGERSACYGQKTAAHRIRVRVTGKLPVRLETMITFRRS